MEMDKLARICASVIGPAQMTYVAMECQHVILGFLHTYGVGLTFPQANLERLILVHIHKIMDCPLRFFLVQVLLNQN